jgi:predicted ATPase
LGEFALAQDHLEQGIALYDPQKHSPLVSRAVQDPGVICLSFAAHIQWYLGYPDQALKRNHKALTLAQEFSHPYSLVYALGHAAILHQFRQEALTVQERSEAVLALANEQGFPLWLVEETIRRGWALAEQGQGEEGIAQIHQGLAARGAVGTKAWQSYQLARLTEAYRKTGQAEEGLSTLSEALALVNRTGERFYEAELYRLKGELTLARSGVRGPASEVPNTQHPTPSTQAEAEACFLKAIEIARKQQAKSLELRVATSLARLWQQQGKKEEGHKMLTEIYGWFTEGFDTKDLQEAKALLDELS